MRTLFLFLLFIFTSIFVFSQERYVSRVFEDTVIIKDIVYSNADSWDPVYTGVYYPEDILLDVYMPDEDG
ncbi:MAG: hypothetical protein C0596_04095 [Marinilabiliales bacterium]|nr:MAG: hypothetical protein C0596_04095 [Marinilabiliales bacterium]